MILYLPLKCFDKCLQFCEIYKLPLLLLIYSCFAYFKTVKAMKAEFKKWKNSVKNTNLCYWILRPPESNTKYVSSTSLGCYKSVTVASDNLFSLYEPIVSFLNSTKYSLDVASMTFGSFLIRDKILEIHAKGVRVRVIVDYNYNNDSGGLAADLINQGIEVIYFKRDIPRDPIFHWKFLLKDYGTPSSCVYVGSANLTNKAYTRKTENFLFTSNKYVIETLHKQFDFYWYLVPVENDTVKRYTFSSPCLRPVYRPGRFYLYKTNYKDIFHNFTCQSV